MPIFLFLAFFQIQISKSKGQRRLGAVLRMLHILLPLDEAIASKAVFVIVSGSDGRAGGRAGGNAFGASWITQKR